MTEDAPKAHVVFPLEVDADGWPPVAERVWACDLGDDRFRIDNAPWFVRDLAVDDLVEARAQAVEEHPTFVRLVTASDHVTIRVICFRAGPLGGSLPAVLDRFLPLGVYAEGSAQYGLVALDVPPTADFRAVYVELTRGTTDGSWTWEEGRTNDAWEAAKVEPGRWRWQRGRNRG